MKTKDDFKEGDIVIITHKLTPFLDMGSTSPKFKSAVCFTEKGREKGCKESFEKGYEVGSGRSS